MKVYITNILPKDLMKKDIQTILDKTTNKKLYIETNEFIELFSKEHGYYIIKNMDTSKLISVTKQSFDQIKDFENMKLDLFFDLTKYNYVNVYSHFPHHYIYTKILERTYKINKSSFVSLTIRYSQDLTSCMVPIDYYINIDNSNNLSVKEILDDLFIKQDFNVLLSGLKEYL